MTLKNLKNAFIFTLFCPSLVGFFQILISTLHAAGEDAQANL